MMTSGTRCILLLLLSLLSPLFRCQPESVELVTGDVTLGAIFSVNNIQGDYGCGDYDVDTLKEVTAVQWFLTAVNNMNYIPGVNIGLKAYRTCQSRERATRNTVHMLENYRVLDDNDQGINTTKPLIGVLGPGRTDEAIVVSRFLSSLPTSQRPLIISGSSTGAALSDRALYSNFFRVIPPDSTQVQVLLKLLDQLGWNYISIVYDDDAYGTDAAGQLRDLVQELDLCVPSFAALPLDYRSQTFITATDTIIDRLRGGDSSIITGVVFIGSAATAREFLTRLALRVTFVRFIFSEAVGLQTSVVSGTTLGKGALAAAPPYLPLPEFRTFWNNLWSDRNVFSSEMQKNPWLAEYYTKKTNCDLSDVHCWTQAQSDLPSIQDNTQWLFEYYQVKATAIFAFILKQLHSDTCGQGFNGLCFRLKQLLRNNRDEVQELVENSVIDLKAEFSSISSIFSNLTSVAFDDRGEVTYEQQDSSLYDVFNYRECEVSSNFCFQEVGTYNVAGELYLDTQTLRGYTDNGDALLWPNFPKSQCMEGHDCLTCIPPHLTSDVIFVPGDFYIVAVIPVYDKLSNQPLKCGDIRSSAGADLAESVLFAVKQVNKKRNSFTGIFASGTLGVVILNSCSRELVIKERLIALHKGTLVLPDGRNSSDILPHIAGYVGAYFSSVSVAAYEVLTGLDTRFVMLSPVNTSPELSDRSKYPLYLRLTSGKDSGVRALLTLVRELGHQYIQVIYDPDDVYTMAIKESINTLNSHKSFNICVVNNIASDDEDTNYYSVLDDLRKNAWAHVVIVALQKEHARKVFGDILPLMTQSDLFRFLGTDAWGRETDVLNVDRATRLLGSLTYSMELPLDQLFKEDLRNTDPLNTINPWLKYFWEERKQCYFDGSYQRKDKTEVCPADLTSNYVQNIWIPLYIDAVYIFALGLNSAMLSHCGQASLCETLTSQHLVKAIRDVRYDLFNTGVPVDVFNENGDGEAFFKIFEVAFDTFTPDPDDLTYVEVGRYERDALTLHSDDLWLVKNLAKTQCPNPKACNACFPVPPPSPTDIKQDDGMPGAVIGTVVVIVILIIVLIVLIVILVIACRRLKAQRERNDQREKFAFDNMSGPSSGGSRPLPPIHGEVAAYETSMGPGSGSGGSQSQVNTYDYLHSVGPHPGTARSSHAYLTQGQTPGISAGGSGAGSGGSSARAPSSIDVNSAGYVTRDSDGRWSYQYAHPPYDRAPSAVPQSEGRISHNSSLPGDWRGPEEGGRQTSRHEDWRSEQAGGPRQNSRIEEGGRQNSRLEDWRSEEAGGQNSRVEDLRREEGGAQNSHLEDRRGPEKGGRQNSIVGESRVSDGSQGPFPLVFENANVSEGGLVVPPPEPCGSAASSGYLTPLGEDYLTPNDDYLTPRLNKLSDI